MTKQRENTDSLPWALPIKLGAVGYFVASIILIADGTKTVPDQIRYVFRNPAVAVWVTLIALQVAAYAALAPALVAGLREYPLPSRKAWHKVLGVGVVALLLFVVFILGHLRLAATNATMPVEQHNIKVMAITFVGVVAFLVTLYGMCAIAITVDNLDEKLPTADRVSQFLKLSNALQWYLLIAGLIVGGATLTTGTLQTAVSTLNTSKSEALATLLSPMTTLLYGLFGSAVIGLYYIPVYATLRSAGMRLCNDLLPIKGNSDDFVSWYERRTKLEALLGLNKDWFDSLKTGLVLLAPLAGSATSLLIGKAQ